MSTMVRRLSGFGFFAGVVFVVLVLGLSMVMSEVLLARASRLGSELLCLIFGIVFVRTFWGMVVSEAWKRVLGGFGFSFVIALLVARLGVWGAVSWLGVGPELSSLFDFSLPSDYEAWSMSVRLWVQELVGLLAVGFAPSVCGKLYYDYLRKRD